MDLRIRRFGGSNPSGCASLTPCQSRFGPPAASRHAAFAGADLDRAIACYPTLTGAWAVLNEFEVIRPAGADELVGRVGIDSRGAVTVARECPVQMTTPEYWQLQDELYSSVEIAEAFPRWPDPHPVGIVQPAIGGGPSPSPLMLWWALLLGLSSLVRYYPRSLGAGNRSR